MEAETFARWAELDASPADIENLRRDWTFHPLLIDGVECAAACMSGSEVHFAIDPAWRRKVISRQRTRQFLAPLFDIHGFLTTRTSAAAGKDEFLQRLGFSRTWGDGVIDNYMMTELPFGERN